MGIAFVHAGEDVNPFSQYPRDLAHNFVLAHPACNRSKSDTLAARPHLERWLSRLEHSADALAEIGRSAGISVDKAVTQKIAAWGYTSAIEHGGNAWIAASRYERIEDVYRRCFVTSQEDEEDLAVRHTSAMQQTRHFDSWIGALYRPRPNTVYRHCLEWTTAMTFTELHLEIALIRVPHPQKPTIRRLIFSQYRFAGAGR